MSKPRLETSTRPLEPIDRISEVLFGLIMVLTFTGSLSVAEAGHEDIRTMLVGALGCNLAWGMIDAILYLMGCMAERGRAAMTLRAVQNAPDAQAAQRVIESAIPPLLASVLQPADFAAMHERLKQIPEPPSIGKLTKEHWVGALGVFLLVFLSTFPVVIPFIVMHSAVPALRISNVIAIGMLFMTGYSFGRITGRNRWAIGLSMVVLGGLLAGVTILLGG